MILANLLIRKVPTGRVAFIFFFASLCTIVNSLPLFAQSTQPLPAFSSTIGDSAKLALTLSAVDEQLTITDSRTGRIWIMASRDIRRDSVGLWLGDSIVITDSVVRISEDTLLLLSDISSVQANRRGKEIRVEIYSQSAVSPATRLRRGNLFRGLENVLVDSGRFIRGSVVSLGGDVEIVGEVNREVISLTGDIRLMPTSLVRGSVVSLFGKITMEDGARYYGEAMSSQPGRRKFRVLASNRFAVNPVLTYDRVDGLTLGLDASYPNDEKQPWQLYGQLGYALASDRLRGEGRLSYRLNRARKVTLSIDGYHRLSHDDDGLTTKLENTILALAFKEDLWDWYEASGGSLSIQAKPLPRLEVEATYRREEISWLPAHPNLWALSGGSGGSHLFRENFSTHPRGPHISPFPFFSDSAGVYSLGEVRLQASYLESPTLRNYEGSGFGADVSFDLGGAFLGGENSYTRISATLRRYQQISKLIQGMVRLTAADGASIHFRQLTLGGFGTLPGYRLREFAADSYLLAKTELRFSLPSKVAALSLLADAARFEDRLNFRTSNISDVGLRLYLSAFAHLTVAAPIGAGNDGQIRTWLSFRHNF